MHVLTLTWSSVGLSPLPEPPVHQIMVSNQPQTQLWGAVIVSAQRHVTAPLAWSCCGGQVDKHVVCCVQQVADLTTRLQETTAQLAARQEAVDELTPKLSRANDRLQQLDAVKAQLVEVSMHNIYAHAALLLINMGRLQEAVYVTVSTKQA